MTRLPFLRDWEPLSVMYRNKLSCSLCRRAGHSHSTCPFSSEEKACTWADRLASPPKSNPKPNPRPKTPLAAAPVRQPQSTSGLKIILPANDIVNREGADNSSKKTKRQKPQKQTPSSPRKTSNKPNQETPTIPRASTRPRSNSANQDKHVATQAKRSKTSTDSVMDTEPQFRIVTGGPRPTSTSQQTNIATANRFDTLTAINSSSTSTSPHNPHNAPTSTLPPFQPPANVGGSPQ